MKEVTLKFFSPNEKLPEKSGNYLTLCGSKNGVKSFIEYIFSKKHQAFNVYDVFDEDSVKECKVENILYWSEVPNLEEEDEEKENP